MQMASQGQPRQGQPPQMRQPGQRRQQPVQFPKPLTPRRRAPQGPRTPPSVLPPAPVPVDGSTSALAVRPVLRAQNNDERATVPALPSPEALGLHPVKNTAPAPAPAADVDYNVLHTRLRELGALSVQMRQLDANSHRITFILPGQQSGRSHMIEVLGRSEAAVVAAALRRANDLAVASR